MWERLPYYGFPEFNGMDLTKIHGFARPFYRQQKSIQYAYYGFLHFSVNIAIPSVADTDSGETAITGMTLTSTVTLLLIVSSPLLK